MSHTVIVTTNHTNTLDNLEQALENAKVELSHERRLLKDKDVHIQRLQTNIENLMSAEPFDAGRRVGEETHAGADNDLTDLSAAPLGE